jgi:hypothetical protein
MTHQYYGSEVINIFWRFVNNNLFIRRFLMISPMKHKQFNMVHAC